MPRLDLFVFLVVAAVIAGITAMLMGEFRPLPLFAGVILVGARSTWRLSRQRG